MYDPHVDHVLTVPALDNWLPEPYPSFTSISHPFPTSSLSLPSPSFSTLPSPPPLEAGPSLQLEVPAGAGPTA